MARWGWLFICFALAVFAALLPREAKAHPLGNFTINHFSRLEFAGDEARIDYVLDYAEIPTFQRKARLDPDDDEELSDAESRSYLNAELASLIENLRLEVGEKVLPLRVRGSSAAYRPGQGGLPILRIEVHLLADLPKDWEDAGAGHFTDRNYEEHLGWREIVVRGGQGIAVRGSTVPSTGVSDELRRYPNDMLSSPLDVRESKFRLVPGEGSDGTVGRAAENLSASNYRLGTNGFIGRLYARLNSLISFTSPSPAVVLVSLLAALLWGAVHAFTPGHGKTVVAAYLIGDRGTAWHAAFLGLTVTLTHTLGVFGLGGVAIYLARYVVPETLFPWLGVVSGALVVAIGLSLLWSRSRGLFRASNGNARNTESRHVHEAHSHALVHAAHSHGDHKHPHSYSHSHGGHAHSHLPPGADGSKVGIRGLVALGISGGLVPCPAALVLLLSAISLGRLGFGMVLVVVFSTGLAIVLTGIGLLMIYARKLFERYSFEAKMPLLLPVVSASLITLVGAGIALGALAQTRIV